MDQARLSRDFEKEPLKLGEKPTYEDLNYLYLELNWSREQIATFIRKSDAQTKKYLAHYKLQKTQAQKLELRKKTTLEKYGVENISQLKEIKEKKEQKALEKYGVKNVFAAKEIKDKIKSVNKERYGVENVAQSEEVIRKIQKTNLERYGSMNLFQSKEIQSKIKETNLKRYGVENAAQNEEVIEKIKKTNNRKYGFNSFMQTEEGRNKAKESCLERYGAKNPMFLQKFKDELKGTQFEKYGCWSSQKHLSKTTLHILESKENLENHLKTKEKWTTKTLADDLDVSISGILKILKKYDLVHYIDFYTSSYELELQSLFSHMHKTKSAIHPYEIDLYDEERKFGIEFNGNYWHSELKLPNNYHQKKSLAAEDAGIFLYHIWEYEWQDPILREKILAQIKNIMNQNERRVFARNCYVKSIYKETAEDFINANHIQGYTVDSVRFGLYENTELLATMTFGKPRFNNKYEWELIRYCSKTNVSVIGGASKLFSHFVKEYEPKSILSYSHIDKGTGRLYEKLGFKMEKITAPDYVWCNGEEVLSRYQCQKHRLNAMGLEGSEREIMDSLGFFRIFGCGNKIWSYSFD